MIRVAVADDGEVEPGNLVASEDGEVCVVREPPVHLDGERTSAGPRRLPGPRPDDPAIGRPSLEKQRGPRRAAGFDVDVGLEAIRDLAIRHQRFRTHQADLFRVGDQHERRPSPRPGGNEARRFQRHRNAKRIVARARGLGAGVVMRQQPECFAALALEHADDVGHACRKAKLGRACVGFLDAHFVAVELQLVDDVRPGAGVGGRANWTGADRAGEHFDVRAGVGFRKQDGLAAAGGKRRDCGKSQEDWSARSHRGQPIIAPAGLT